MKISELVEKLMDIQNEHGDLPVIHETGEDTYSRVRVVVVLQDGEEYTSVKLS